MIDQNLFGFLRFFLIHQNVVVINFEANLSTLIINGLIFITQHDIFVEVK